MANVLATTKLSQLTLPGSKDGFSTQDLCAHHVRTLVLEGCRKGPFIGLQPIRKRWVDRGAVELRGKLSTAS